MKALRPWIATLVLAPLASTGGCASYAEKLEEFRLAYGRADFAAAEDQIDELLADFTDVDQEVVTSSRGLHPGIALSDGDVCLLGLEKAMLRLARGDQEASVELLREARDVLDQRLPQDMGKILDQIAAAATDDRALEYTGADYEHLLVRVMLTLGDLLQGGEDAYAYATQIGEKQEEIIGSSFGAIGDDDSYQPRQSYRRLGIGAYLQGVIQEANLSPDEAARAYRRALEYEPDTAMFEAAVERAANGNYAAAGNGVLHVFYLAGRGPHLVETNESPTAQALQIAGVMLLIIGGDATLIAQKPVPTPAVRVTDSQLPLLEVSAPSASTETAPVLDVNRVAVEQLEANQGWIVARALVRRALKSGAAKLAERGARKAGASSGWAHVVGVVVSFFSTVIEKADTRSWNALPAEIHAARLELPEGEHDLQFGRQGQANVKITAGRDSYVVIVRPNLRGPGQIMVDRYSQIIPQP